jgi:hypothetical protein
MKDIFIIQKYTALIYLSHQLAMLANRFTKYQGMYNKDLSSDRTVIGSFKAHFIPNPNIVGQRSREMRLGGKPGL